MKHFFILTLALTFVLSVCPLSTHGLIVPEKAFLPGIAVHDPYKKIREYFFWWRSLPTIGLEEHSSWSPVFYPFIPHFFSLQTLAPLQGKSVTIGLIDNGVASTTLLNTDKNVVLKAHEYLTAVVSAPACIPEGSGKVCWAEFQELMNFCIKPEQRAYTRKVFATYTPDLVEPLFLEHFLKQYGYPHYLTKVLACAASLNTFSILSVPSFITTQVRVPYYADQRWLAANHGSHCAGLIVGKSSQKIIGIASYASLISIKAIPSEKVYHDALPLVRALKYVDDNKIPIISLSYSMQNSGGYAVEIQKYFKKIAFSCIAAGNIPDKAQENYLSTLTSITASVGSFGMSFDHNTKEYIFKISSFSSAPYKDVWHVLLPGEAMLSCCYPVSSKFDSTLLVFMQGTSTSTPLLAGFFSLMVAEFYPILNYDQIKMIVRYATVSLHDTPSWRKSSGTLDMRMALFMGHVLKTLLITDEKDVTLYFHDYVTCTRRYLLQLVNKYGEEQRVGIHFEDGMIDFLQKARNKSHSLLYTQQNLEKSIATTAQAVKMLLRN